MKKAWIVLVILGLILTVGAPGQAQNYGDDICPDANNTFIVDTQADADKVANGYVNETCFLKIQFTISPINLSQLIIKARQIEVLGPLNIINPVAGGEIDLIAVGNLALVDIRNATIQATGVIKLVSERGNVRVENSSVIAANPLGDTSSNVGELLISARFDIDLLNSTIYGGSGVHMQAQLGHLTWKCGEGSGGTCKDPNVPPIPPIIVQFCGDPIQFPCKPTFNTPAELKSACIPTAQPQTCGGGCNQIRIFAFLDIDITGSTIIVCDHITFESATGSLLAENSTLTGRNNLPVKDAVNVSVFKTVDLDNAHWDAQRIQIETKGGCSAPTVCISANGANTFIHALDVVAMTANNGLGIVSVCDQAEVFIGVNGKPILNGAFAPPGGPLVRVTAATCGALGPPDKPNATSTP